MGYNNVRAFPISTPPPARIGAARRAVRQALDAAGTRPLLPTCQPGLVSLESSDGLTLELF